MKKEFDCVKMKNDIQMRLYEKRKNMTPQEEMEDIRKTLAESQSPIAKWWRKIQKTPTLSHSPAIH